MIDFTRVSHFTLDHTRPPWGFRHLVIEHRGLRRDEFWVLPIRVRHNHTRGFRVVIKREVDE